MRKVILSVDREDQSRIYEHLCDDYEIYSCRKERLKFAIEDGDVFVVSSENLKELLCENQLPNDKLATEIENLRSQINDQLINGKNKNLHKISNLLIFLSFLAIVFLTLYIFEILEKGTIQIGTVMVVVSYVFREVAEKWFKKLSGKEGDTQKITP